VYYTKRFSEHKALELSIGQKGWNHNYLTIDICWNKEQSHAGFHFLVAIWKLNCEFNLCDVRHWDYEKDEWEEVGIGA
jgi:hypothetical protein